MGLFSTLASATTTSDGQAKLKKSPHVLASSSSSSSSLSSSAAEIPTLFQLYAGGDYDGTTTKHQHQHNLILMENTSTVTGYTMLTYQAIQVGGNSTRDDSTEVINKHPNPDLGVWNYRVAVGGAISGANIMNNNSSNSSRMVNNSREQQRPSTTSSTLTNSLLTKLTDQTAVYCLTVDLSDETSVEPNLSALQAALVRLLIEQGPSSAVTKNNDTAPATASVNDDRIIDDPASNNNDDNSRKNIKSTSLYDLQAVQFGLASEEKNTGQSIEESAKDVKIGLMICAVITPSSSSSDGKNKNSTSNNQTTVDMSSESAYKKKQARALVVYHLRKFANAINAALCFVERPDHNMDHKQPVLSTKGEAANTVQATTTETSVSNNETTTTTNNNNSTEDTQIAISYDKLSQLWRDMAMGFPIWDQQFTAREEVQDGAAATALYGPGRQQEDLIENLLLRNANYPGHWDASKDSLWVALPQDPSNSTTSKSTTVSSTTVTGDDGWLTQLRQSIVSALPTVDKSSSSKNKSAAKDDGKPKEKDAAVSSFFESLLKNP